MRFALHVALVTVIASTAGCDFFPLYGDDTDVQPAFALTNASLEVDETSYGSSISITDDTFTYLFIWVKDAGLFTVGVRPFGDAVKEGRFAGAVLEFERSDTSVRIVSEEQILSTRPHRAAWVEFIAGFTMLDEGDIPPPDIVIGLADTREQIPWFDRQ